MCDSPFVLTPQAVWIACNHAVNYVLETGIKVSIPQAVLIACNFKEVTVPSKPLACFNTASGMDCMQYRFTLNSLICFLSFNTASGMDCMQFEVQFCRGRGSWFQYRKRYGLHAIMSQACLKFPIGVSIPQAVWIACNELISTLLARMFGCFNTASGMDCMQYRPSQPLGQLNPEAGFLNGSLFLANRRNLAGFFCRQNRLKTSVNPVISRKLLSTGKI